MDAEGQLRGCGTVRPDSRHGLCWGLPVLHGAVPAGRGLQPVAVGLGRKPPLLSAAVFVLWLEWSILVHRLQGSGLTVPCRDCLMWAASAAMVSGLKICC